MSEHLDHDPRLGSRLVHALETAYESIREVCPDIPTNVVFITGTGRAREGGALKYGHFAHDRWATRDSSTHPTAPTVHEIMVTGEGLSEGALHAFTTVAHEAVHALALKRRIQDTSRQGRYHNRRFVELSEEIGMHYAHGKADPTLGFSAVTLTDATAKIFAHEIEALDRAIRLAIDAGQLKATRKARRASRVIRCTFPLPGLTRSGLTRATRLDVPPKLYDRISPFLTAHETEEVIR